MKATELRQLAQWSRKFNKTPLTSAGDPELDHVFFNTGTMHIFYQTKDGRFMVPASGENRKMLFKVKEQAVVHLWLTRIRKAPTKSAVI